MRKNVIPFLLIILILLTGCHNAVQIESKAPIQVDETTVTRDENAAVGSSETVKEAEKRIAPFDTADRDDATTAETSPEENSSADADTVCNNGTGEEPEVTTGSAEDTDQTAANEIPSAMELKKIGNLQYYLYSPKDSTDGMPLIIYLHGGTNKKADVRELLTTEGFPKYLYEGYYGDLRAYVAVPKLSNNCKGWADVYEQIRNLIKDLNKNYGISVSKVSLTGHSMGGTGTYQLQIKLPNTFACIAPMSGSIRNTGENLAALAKTKVWAFVGSNDTVVKPESSRMIISALQERGSNAAITEFNGATHFDVPALGYKNNDLICWLVNCGS